MNLQTGEHKVLIRDGSQAEYVEAPPSSTQGGYLVYATEGALSAVRFSPHTLEVLSDPVTVVERVLTKGSGAADFSVSRGGTLVFVTAREVAGTVRSLVWVDRHGREEAISAPARPYGVVRLSPDGALAALDIRDAQDDVWIWSFARQTLTPLTFGHSDNNPVWSADGRHVIFRSARAGAANLFRQAADGTGIAERLTTSSSSQTPKAATPDGKRILFTAVGDATSANDLHTLNPGEPKTDPLIQTAFLKNDPSVSSDGRWLAYESNESGRLEVYVRPFPSVNEGRWQVSMGGGRQPQWSRDGRELFYLDGAGFLTSVPVETRTTFAAAKPTRALDTRYFSSNGPWTYDISSDGQRFLMLKDATPADTNSAPASMVVVVNWLEELKSRFSQK
jgi:serine/threonine-protein kinase